MDVKPRMSESQITEWIVSVWPRLIRPAKMRSGERILAGRIRRGHTETIHSVIWLSDMRGFTSMADRLPPQMLVDLLNLYFDCQVPVILKHGGEVLKFIGDGLLAIFPLAEG